MSNHLYKSTRSRTQEVGPCKGGRTGTVTEYRPEICKPADYKYKNERKNMQEIFRCCKRGYEEGWSKRRKHQDEELIEKIVPQTAVATTLEMLNDKEVL